LSNRRGAIIVLTAIMMVVMMAMLALSIDVGYICQSRTELQRALDAAALAGAGALVEGQESAQIRAVEYLVRNPVGSQPFLEDEDELEDRIQQFLLDHGDELEIQLGHWDAETQQMEITDYLPSTIGVKLTYANQPLFFAPFLGRDNFALTAEAVAMYQPRDIMLVLDFSASMNDDSEFKSIGVLGRQAVEDNLEEIWNDLGQPKYRNVLKFNPKWIKVKGQPPQNNSQPQIKVQYRYTKVKIWSTKDLSNVVLKYSNGVEQKFDGLSGKQGVFQGTGYNSGRSIYRVWVKSGNNASGEGPGYGEPFDFHPNTINTTIKNTLKLDTVSYPYASGSWSDYINYCKSSSGQNKDAGYRYKFGYMNLINYWLDRKPTHYQTEDLWMASAQPVTAVKDAVDVFMDYVREVDTNDRVGVSLYNASDGDGELETELTFNYTLVENIVRERQAGHYHHYTNIGAGMQTAREELDANARTGAFKMIVVMTDGNANWVNGGYNTWAARQYVIDEANLAADSHYRIVTISLGAHADTSLMEQVAEIGNGTHFVIPGGQSVQDYTEDLIEIFHNIAKDRPLKLVK